MTSLQVRNVPEPVQRVLKQRAAEAGQSLSEYVLTQLTRLAAQPTLDELTRRVRSRGAVEEGTSAADLLRRDRARDGGC